MANPIHSLSRPDKRPAAGVNLALPEWAKGDYVLERWVKEERQRRRNWLVDQELHPSEPRPEWRPASLYQERIKDPFERMINPVDKMTGNRLRSLIFKGSTFVKWVILPMWVTHYVFKYHILTKPGYFVTSKLADYPDDPLHTGGSGHH